MLRELWTTVRGRRVFARVPAAPGARPALLMVHGAVVSSDYFLPLAKRASSFVDCYAVEMPGYGRSEAHEAPLGVEELAHWLAEWMTAAAVPPGILLGNSLGAQVAAAFAQRHPHRVEKLVLVGPTVDPASRSRVGQLARLFADAFLERPTLHLIWARDLARAGLRLGWRTLDVALDDAIEARLPEISAETLVIRGEHDPLAPARWASEATRLLRNGRLVTIEGAGHGAHHRRPDAVAAALRHFLSS